MKLTLLLAFRNLFRQKRRNGLLALVIAFSMAVLITASSLGAGMTDTILNKIIVRLIGHIQLDMTEKVKTGKNIIRDAPRIEKAVRDGIGGIVSVQEKVMVYGRGIGNRRGSDIFLEGIEPTPDFFQTLHLSAGTAEDFQNDKTGFAVVISKPYMKKLNVKLNDIIRAQLVTVNGQVQTADLRVAGIQKEEGSSVFQDDAIYMKVQDLKKILGYREHETRLLLIAIQDTSRLREDREKLAAIFDPSPAVIPGQMIVRQKNVPASVLSYFTNADSLAIFTNGLSFASGNLPGPEKETGDGPAWIVLSLPLASAMGIRTGDSAVFYYKNKYGSVNTTNQYRVAGIFLTNRYTGVNTAYVSENVLYRNYFENIPDDSAAGYIPGPENLIYPSLTTEWQMFPPYHDDTEKDKIVNRLNTTSWKGSLLRISTMNEEGAHLLQYAVLMKMVTIVGILVLFLISQIGVMNTLRMSIRERTREIGTMRSIGFQKSQVRNMFVWETLFLTLFAAVVGIVLSFTLMGILSLVPIHTNNEVLTIFLLNERLYFLTDIGAVFLYLVTLAAAAALTAYFPARKASNMTAAEALCQRE